MSGGHFDYKQWHITEIVVVRKLMRNLKMNIGVNLIGMNNTLKTSTTTNTQMR